MHRLNLRRRIGTSANEFDMSDYDSEDFDDYSYDEYSADEFFELDENQKGEDIKEIKINVITVDEIERRQNEEVKQLDDLLALGKPICTALLYHYKWQLETAMERYIDNPQKTLHAVGIDNTNEFTSAKISKAFSNFDCPICCKSAQDEPGMEEFSLACGHACCKDCYAYFLTQKINEGESGLMKCWGAKCSFTIPFNLIEQLVGPETFRKYMIFWNRSFVQGTDRLSWCPAPDCEYVIEANIRKCDINDELAGVQCKCGELFCFACGLEYHDPSPCKLVKAWKKKCSDDSETSNWMTANTKDCPKCLWMIQKNGGCNHMTCRNCRYEFCWICMGEWKEHGTQYYNCSAFDSKKKEQEKEVQSRSRMFLEKYLHYYNRFQIHQQSISLDKETFNRVEAKMKIMQTESNMSWIEVQFLRQVLDTLVRARRTLAWTYALAYYLCSSHILEIFASNQSDLEVATENLSELLELPADEVVELKMQMLDKCAYVASRQKILQDFAVKSMKDGSFQFNELAEGIVADTKLDNPDTTKLKKDTAALKSAIHSVKKELRNTRRRR